MSSRHRRGCALRIAAPALALALPFLTGQLAWAQEGGSRALSIESGVSISETLTDNAHLTSTDKSAEAITQLTATLRVRSRSGRVRGSLDYALTGYVYAKDSGSSSTQNALNATVRADLVENWLWIDGGAQISQQAVSAFGTQSLTPGLVSGNRSEVRSLQVSPNLRGTLSGVVNYHASLLYGLTRTDAAGALGNTDTSSGSLSLSSARGGVFGWSATASRQHSNYAASRSTEVDTAQVSLSYLALPELRTTATAGREWTDHTTQQKTGNATWGVGATWSPSARTTLNAQFDHRFFGNGYQLAFEHRFPLSAIRLSSLRNVSNSSSQAPGGAFATAYDLFFSQFASIEPDPVKRDDRVRAFLQANGIIPSTLVAPGFLAGAASLQQLTQLSYSLQGARSTLTASASVSNTRRLDTLATGQDDLSQSDVVRQRSLGLTLGHRLTPVMGVSLDLSRQASSGSTSSQANVLKSIRLGLTTTLGRRSTASLSARHVQFDSTTQPYTENAVVATFGLTF